MVALVRCLAVLALLTSTVHVASAQVLTVQGDRLAVDGTPKFLVFVSYFGALGADNPAADLQYFKSKGFDGIRIWPTVFTGPQLMRADGSIVPDSLARLKYVLDRASDLRLVVDVSFTAEHIPGLDAARFRDGIMAATQELKSYRNLLFDIQNERNVYGPFRRPLAAEDVIRIRDGIKSIDPERVVTASNSSERTADFASDFAAQTNLDVTAYHDPRTSQFAEPPWVKQLVDQLKASGRPAYFQEPMPTRYVFFPASYRSDLYLQQMAYAKLYGAAAWCFHTVLGVEDLHGVLFQNLIEGEVEPELNFVNALVPRVQLRTSNGVNFVTAESGGGADVRADRNNPGLWESFKMVVLSGGPVVSGDRVAFQSSDGAHYLSAVGGGGATLRAVATQIGPSETFIIEKADGGLIRSGDSITLRAASGAWYVTAESGGGAGVNVNRPSPGAWESFTVVFLR